MFEKFIISVALDKISYVRSIAKKLLQPSGHLETCTNISKLSYDESRVRGSLFMGQENRFLFLLLYVVPNLLAALRAAPAFSWHEHSIA